MEKPIEVIGEVWGTGKGWSGRRPVYAARRIVRGGDKGKIEVTIRIGRGMIKKKIKAEDFICRHSYIKEVRGHKICRICREVLDA